MRKLLLLFTVLFLISAFPALAQDPSNHILEPDPSIASESPYKASRNYGKRIAVFSFA